MASLPPPDWGDREPTREEYLSLLCAECRRRGLVDWNSHVSMQDIMASMPSFDEYRRITGKLNLWGLSLEESLDPKNWEHRSDAFQSSGDWVEPGPFAQLEKERDWDEKRRVLLEKFRDLHIADIERDVVSDFTRVGGTLDRLRELREQHPVNAILYWLADLWNFSKAQDEERSDSAGEGMLRIKVFSDIPQENLSVVNLIIPHNTTWAGFKKTMDETPIVRYLVKKNDPELAKTLFIDDHTVWPPEGFFPPLDNEGNIINPEQYARPKKDYDLPGNG